MQIIVSLLCCTELCVHGEYFRRIFLAPQHHIRLQRIPQRIPQRPCARTNPFQYPWHSLRDIYQDVFLILDTNGDMFGGTRQELGMWTMGPSTSPNRTHRN